MLNLFFVLVTSEKKDYEELKECSETIQLPLYTRCLIPQGGTTFDSKQELYIYLHSSSEANLSFTLLDTPTTVLPQLPRGKGIHLLTLKLNVNLPRVVLQPFGILIMAKKILFSLLMRQVLFITMAKNSLIAM